MSPTLLALAPPRTLTLGEFARLVNGTLRGPADPARLIRGFTTLEKAGAEDISFLANPKFADSANASAAGAILIAAGMELEAQKTRIEVVSVWEAIVLALRYFCPPGQEEKGIHPTAVISPRAHVQTDVTIGPLAVIESEARIGRGASIGAQCFVGRGAVLGDGVVLHPRATVMAGVELGREVIVHGGAVLGADGFKYEMIGGRLTKVPQVGTVIIEDQVEIGANSTIDRASLTETRVGARTKIDNLVHLAHNVSVGSDCIIIAQVGVAGSTRIGRGCVLAGQVGVADNVIIGDGVRLGAQSGVKDSILEPGDYLGSPPLPVREQARVMISIKKLPELFKQVRELAKNFRKDPS
jgi:UDP-3-O-[3-hydroxymyristoyl] glucosamine N-acyltransferase